MFLRIIVILFALALLAGVIANIVTPPGSHPWPKSDTARSQIQMLENYANDTRNPFLGISSLDNVSFVSTAKLTRALWVSSQMCKYNSKGELLDPWGLPYIVRNDNSHIAITSPGLEQYNKKSSFQKYWSNE
jgi:hypothetical protein